MKALPKHLHQVATLALLAAALFAAPLTGAFQHNASAILLMGAQLARLERWYELPVVSPPLPSISAARCDYLSIVRPFVEVSKSPSIAATSATACVFSPQAQLAAIWQARAAWQAGQRGTACAIWEQADFPRDPWTLAQYAATQQQWTVVNDSLACLNYWSQPATTASRAVSSIGISTASIEGLYGKLSDHYVATGRLDEALAAYTHMATWHQGVSASAVIGIATVLASRGQVTEAIATFDTALAYTNTADTSTRYILLVRLGELANRDGQRDRAISAFQDARKAAPLNPNPFYALWYTYTAKRNYASALAIIDEGLSLPVSSAPAERLRFLTLRGDALQQLSRWDEAYCAYSFALVLQSQQPIPVVIPNSSLDAGKVSKTRALAASPGNCAIP